MSVKELKEVLIFGKKQKEENHNVLKELSSEISKDISQNVSLQNQKTEKILHNLENCGFIKKLENFFPNSKKTKYYFYDLQLRNFLIQDFRGFDEREDYYELFENYMIIERCKKLEKESRKTEVFFWKKDEDEDIVFVEKRDNYLQGFELEKEEKISDKCISDFVRENPGAGFRYINSNSQEDMEWFLGKGFEERMKKFDKVKIF